MSKYKNLGFGLGLRSNHFTNIIEQPKKVDWFEALGENFMGIEACGQSPLILKLLKIRENYPIVLHFVSGNIGGTDPIDKLFLKQQKKLIETVKPEWISDHLCWIGVHGQNSHELLPMPYTKEAVDHVSSRIEQVQDFLGQRYMIENTSSYISFEHSEMEEWEFISEIIKKTDCGLLLDVNNVFVSSQNHEYKPIDFIKGIPKENVGQIHLAGHDRRDNGLIIDTHDQPVCDEVFDLLAETTKIIGPVSTMVEWDDEIPSFDLYVEEIMKAKSVITGAQKI